MTSNADTLRHGMNVIETCRVLFESEVHTNNHVWKALVLDHPEESPLSVANYYMGEALHNQWLANEVIILNWDRDVVEAKIDAQLRSEGSAYQRPDFELGQL